MIYYNLIILTSYYYENEEKEEDLNIVAVASNYSIKTTIY